MSEFGPSLRNEILTAGVSLALLVSGCAGKAKVAADTDRLAIPGDCDTKVLYDFSMEKGDYTDILGVENKAGQKNAIGLGYDDLPVKNPNDPPSEYPDVEEPSDDEEETTSVVSVTSFAGKLANPKAWFEDVVDDFFEPGSGNTSQIMESGGSYALDFDQIDEDTISVQAVICGSPDKENLQKIEEKEQEYLQNNPIPPESPKPPHNAQPKNS